MKAAAEHGFGLIAMLAGALLVFDVLWVVYGGVPKESHDHVISKVDGGTKFWADFPT